MFTDNSGRRFSPSAGGSHDVDVVCHMVTRLDQGSPSLNVAAYSVLVAGGTSGDVSTSDSSFALGAPSRVIDGNEEWNRDDLRR